MLSDILEAPQGRALRVLCVGAHCDDIEIGCGASLLRLQAHDRKVTVDWVVLCGSADRRKETLSALNMFLEPRNRGECLHGGFPDGRLPAVYSSVKDYFESLKERARPDVIFCHEREDRHQDHRIVNEMVWSTFRDHLVLEYEIPKWDGGLGQPNLYIPVDERQVLAKADALLEAYPSQAGKDWFKRDVFVALMRMRGLECRSPSGYAEAFHARKIRLNVP